MPENYFGLISVYSFVAYSVFNFLALSIFYYFHRKEYPFVYNVVFAIIGSLLNILICRYPVPLPESGFEIFRGDGSIDRGVAFNNHYLLVVLGGLIMYGLGCYWIRKPKLVLKMALIPGFIKIAVSWIAIIDCYDKIPIVYSHWLSYLE